MDEKRQHKRYNVKGQAAFLTPSGPSSGEVVSVSGGGLLMLSKNSLPGGSDVEVRFTVQGYGGEIHCKARVAHSHVGMLGILFLEEPPGLPELLLSLEKG